MRPTDEFLVDCPHCWERIAFELDQSDPGVHELIEDCPVCCSPIALRLTVGDDGSPALEARHPDE
jgi:hypothetical protein